MEKVTWKECPLCHGNELSFVHECKDFTASQETFPIYRCSSCGFTFTQDFPDESVIGPYYDAPEYISHSDTDKGLMNKVYHAARTFMLNRKCKWVEKASRLDTGRILDYGAGTGYFANTMQQRGWSVQAIEKSPSARAFGKEHFHIDMQDEPAFYDMEAESFDAITMWHVLEHVQQIDKLFEQLFKVLKPGGVLVIAVPNSASMDALYYKERWAAYDVPRHLWHFSAKTLCKWGEKHGFRQTGATQPMPLDAFYISMLSEKNYASSASFAKGLWRGFVCLLQSLGNPEASSSIVCTFKKQ